MILDLIQQKYDVSKHTFWLELLYIVKQSKVSKIRQNSKEILKERVPFEGNQPNN